MLQVGCARRVKGAIDHGAVIRQHFAPVGQKLRIVVLSNAMRFESTPHINMHAIGVLTLDRGSSGSYSLPGGWPRGRHHGEHQAQRSEREVHETLSRIFVL